MPTYKYNNYPFEVIHTNVWRSHRWRFRLSLFMTRLPCFHTSSTHANDDAGCNCHANSFLFIAFCLHLFTFNALKSFSTSFSYPNLGLPIYLLPSGSLSDIFITTLFLWFSSDIPGTLIFSFYVYYHIWTPIFVTFLCWNFFFLLLFILNFILSFFIQIWYRNLPASPSNVFCITFDIVFLHCLCLFFLYSWWRPQCRLKATLFISLLHL